MSGVSAWEAAKSALTVGSVVSGVVIRHEPFGIVVEVRDHPAVPAVIDVISYRPAGVDAQPADWPPVGTTIEAVVAALTEHNRQIKLRVGPSQRP